MSERGHFQGPDPVENRNGSDVEIDAEELEAAQRDPEVQAFLEEARAEGERLEEEGLIHP